MRLGPDPLALEESRGNIGASRLHGSSVWKSWDLGLSVRSSGRCG